MITQEIVNYVKGERAKNTPDAVIKTQLLANGWTEKDVTDAMSGTVDVVKVTEDLKVFRNKTKWTIFFVWAGLNLAFLIFTSITGNSLLALFGPGTWIFEVPFLLVIYMCAYIASRGAQPAEEKWQEGTELFFRIVSAGALILMIGSVVFFVACLYSIGNI